MVLGFIQEAGSATEFQKQNSLIKERVWDWLLRKGKGSRSRQREKPSCGAGQIASADTTSSSEAEMMTHQLFQVRPKPLGLYISVSISHWTWLLLKAKGRQQSEAEAVPEGDDGWKNNNAPKSWANESFLEEGSGKCISVSIQAQYLGRWRNAVTPMLILFYHSSRERRKTSACSNPKLENLLQRSG